MKTVEFEKVKVGDLVEKELEIIKTYEPNLYKAVNSIFGESYRYTRNYKRYVAFMGGKVEKRNKADKKQCDGQMSLFDT